MASADGDDAPDPEAVVAEAAKRRAERNGRQSGKHKKICLTDPDATMATNARNRRLEPAYKQHTTVDDVFGVVLARLAAAPGRAPAACAHAREAAP